MAQGIVSLTPDEAEVEIEDLLDSGYVVTSLTTAPTSEGPRVFVIYEYDEEEETETAVERPADGPRAVRL